MVLVPFSTWKFWGWGHLQVLRGDRIRGLPEGYEVWGHPLEAASSRSRALPSFPPQNVEKTLIRPMAFKPVIPKIRTAPGPASLGVRPAAPALSESQVSLTHLLGAAGAEKPGSLSCRASSHSGTLSDSGRNSLSSLPTYSTGCSQHAEAGALPATPHGHPEPPGGYRPPAGPSNSDSGRSSSSKSTGSLSGRGRPSSESGSCGRSPLPGEEALLVRELEDKLREREAELQQLRDSLDENEVAICQVGARGG